MTQWRRWSDASYSYHAYAAFRQIRRKYVCHTRTSTRQVPAGRPARHSFWTLRRRIVLVASMSSVSHESPPCSIMAAGGSRPVIHHAPSLTLSWLRNNNNKKRSGPRASANVARERVWIHVRRKLAFHFYHYLGHGWATLYKPATAEEEN